MPVIVGIDVETCSSMPGSVIELGLAGPGGVIKTWIVNPGAHVRINQESLTVSGIQPSEFRRGQPLADVWAEATDWQAP